MNRAGWGHYETRENGSIGALEIEGLIEAVDAANWEEDLELGEPVPGEFDPTEDDPE